MGLRHLLLISILFSVLPMASFSEDAKLNSFDKNLRQAAQEFTDNYTKARNTKSWILSLTSLTPADKRALLGLSLSQKLPRIHFSYDQQSINVEIEKLKLSFRSGENSSIYVNGKKGFVDPKWTFFKTWEEIEKIRLGKQVISSSHKWNSFARLWSGDLVQAETHIESACLSDNEGFFKNEASLLESKAAYIGYIFVASMTVDMLRQAQHYVMGKSCEVQRKELKALLAEQKLSIRHFNCSSENSLLDPTVEFWTREKEEGKKRHKTKTFNLDYIRLLAQEVPDDKDEKDDEEHETKKEIDVFSFNNDELIAVKTLKYNAEAKKFVCSTVNPKEKAEEFNKKKDYIEAYRKVFYYVGENQTCSFCRQVLELDMRTLKPDFAEHEEAKKIPVAPTATETSDDESPNGAQ